MPSTVLISPWEMFSCAQARRHRNQISEFLLHLDCSFSSVASCCSSQYWFKSWLPACYASYTSLLLRASSRHYHNSLSFIIIADDSNSTFLLGCFASLTILLAVKIVLNRVFLGLFPSLSWAWRQYSLHSQYWSLSANLFSWSAAAAATDLAC